MVRGRQKFPTPRPCKPLNARRPCGMLLSWGRAGGGGGGGLVCRGDYLRGAKGVVALKQSVLFHKRDTSLTNTAFTFRVQGPL